MEKLKQIMYGVTDFALIRGGDIVPYESSRSKGEDGRDV